MTSRINSKIVVFFTSLPWHQDQLDLLRKEKSEIDETLVALQSRMEEQHKATQKNEPVCTAKIDTTARETEQTRIDEPTTERNSGREQHDLFTV